MLRAQVAAVAYGFFGWERLRSGKPKVVKPAAKHAPAGGAWPLWLSIGVVGSACHLRGPDHRPL